MNPVGGFAWLSKSSDLSLYNYTPQINVGATGERKLVVTGSSHIVTGTQIGDSGIDLPEAPMEFGGSGLFGHVISGTGPASITVEIFTDQNVGNASLSSWRRIIDMGY
jgi:hypothetical protein